MRTEISEGTNPAGSQWTKNPIAPCDGEVGGASAPFNFPLISNCNKAMFPPILSDVVPAHPPYFKLPGLYGYGIGSIGQAISGIGEGGFFWDRFRFHIFDKKNRTAFPATRVSEGTNPAGSQ